MAHRNVLIGMSGGVDSSVAVTLLQRGGYNCSGCNLLLACGEGAEDARLAAERFAIPFQVVDLRAEFRREVQDRFVSVYEAGETPNPCIDCNRSLKFGAMLDIALSQGFDAVATGHYARIRYNEESGRYLLYKAADRAKDQTYFLYCLNQRQLSHALFPLGELTKEQVREIAQEEGLLNARKRDSQDICFIPDGDYFAFLEQHTGKHYSQGDYLDLSGKVVGRHRGAAAYTIGQRKGLGIALGEPVYVCAKDMVRNTVTVGPNEALFSSELTAKNLNWIPFPALTEPMSLTAKIRHSQNEQPCTVVPQGNQVRVVFTQPQRAATPGQAVVFYQDDLVVGGGTICSPAE